MVHPKKIIYRPVCLSEGDTIGIAAPAGPFDQQKFNQGLEVIKGMGFKVLVPEGLDRKNHYLAGDDAHRAQIFNRLVRDESVKAILCARGGFGVIRILGQLDLDAIRTNPKIVMGFSDITILLLFLHQTCRLVTFHGPMVTTLADADEKTKASLYKTLHSARRLKIVPREPLTLRSGVAKGPVIGGNLATLCHLVGTPYAPELKGCILVLEDVNEAPYKIDRMLIQMKLAGWFENLAGLVLGDFSDSGQTDSIHPIFQSIFSDVNIPILSGFDIGHGKCNITLPIGLTATLDADRHFLQYHQSATVLENE